MENDALGLTYHWSPIYSPAWDNAPGEYLERGLVGWDSSRRLARVENPARAFKAYLGVRHFDPGRWNVPGEPTTTFFLSLFLRNHTVSMHTYPILGAARAALEQFHASLSSE